MTSWTGSSNCLKISADIFSVKAKLIVVLGGLAFAAPLLNPVSAQHSFQTESVSYSEFRILPGKFSEDTTAKEPKQTSGAFKEVPEPKSVLYKSLMLPGWGQVINQQAWKVPIIYGAFAGLGWYSSYLTKKYHDYRAAYYNSQYPDREPKFGQTPGYINPGIPTSSLQSIRNDFRNRRDFIYVTMVLMYGLNAVDAYVFAHLRDFNVSDDLSMDMSLKPEANPFLARGAQDQIPVMFSLTFHLNSR